MGTNGNPAEPDELPHPFESDGTFCDVCGMPDTYTLHGVGSALGGGVSGVKFTPGPWFPNKVQASGDWTVRAVKENRPIARVWVEDRTELHQNEFAVAEADAHLIAAAPELYEALEEALEWVDQTERGGNAAYRDGLAALAKARGEAP